MNDSEEVSEIGSVSRSLRRFKSFAEQDAATFLYWRDKTIGERMEATAELVRSGYGVRGIDADGAPLEGTSAADFRDQESIFQIGAEPSRVDIIQQVPGVVFESAWARRVAGVVDGTHEIFFISRDDLITNKLESGRPQDLADVNHLRRAGSTHPLK